MKDEKLEVEVEVEKDSEDLKEERKKFWIKLVSWVTLAYIIPAGFIIYRFDLFKKSDRISVGGWGLIFIIFTGIMLTYIMKEIRTGLKPGPAKQIVNGICQVTLPLFIATLVVYWLEDYTKNLFQVLMMLLICETVAIPLNPLPEWRRKNNMDDDYFSFKAFVDFLRKSDKK